MENEAKSMDGVFQATAGFQDSGIFQKAVKCLLEAF